MTPLAAIRADSVNFPLFLHVLGAMLLVGTLFAVSTAILMAWRRSEPSEAVGLTRFGLWTLVAGVLPAYVLMRVGAQWTESEENLPEEVEDSAWLGIGYVTADLGAVLVLVSIVLSALGLRRLRRGSGTGLGKAVGVIATLLLAAYVVAVWAMTAKPD
jgi:NADH:ubiquinone oxidoreductase subunit 6 (subunit J)